MTIPDVKKLTQKDYEYLIDGIRISNTRITELEDKVEHLENGFGGRDYLKERIKIIEAEREKLREALRPFANYACDEPHFNEPDCNNCVARKTLNGEKP